jgi:prepilin-type N-terminal cleavage/methylation domain-containing protein
MHKVKTSRSGFTLIELLIVVVIVSILAIVVVLTINIPELLRQSRDGARFSDMKTLNGDVMLYLNELPNGNTGSSSTIYVSLPDKTLSGNQTSTCTSLGLPTPPTGYTYQCSSPQSFRHVDGTGWVPVNFSKLSSGAPLSALPVDPVNQSSTGLYYTYTTIGPSYVFTALSESQKQKQALGTTLQIPDYPDVIAQGTDVTVNPLFGATGLVGYWNFDEGTGTTAYDSSGSGNNGGWYGTTPYYVTGKVGPYTGNFDGSTDYVDAGVSTVLNFGSGNFSMVAWIKTSQTPSVVGRIITKRAAGGDSSWYSLFINPSGYLQLETTGGNGNSTVAVNNGQWHQIVAVKVGTAISYYVDGSAAGTTTGAANITTTSNLTIGDWIGAPGTQNFSGQIDDVRIYNRALSQSEISQLYTLGQSQVTYNRYFYLTNVYRDSSGNVVTSGGTYDPSTEQVTVVYGWQGGPTNTMSTYVVRGKNNVFSQNDWSGGPGLNGPVTSTNSQFASSSNIDYQTSTGSIYVSIPGY